MLYKWLSRGLLLCVAPFVCKSSCNVITHLPIPLYTHQLGYGTDPNIIYLFGGITTGYNYINDIYKWNSTASTTFMKLSLITPTIYFLSYCADNIVSLNDKIYFAGIEDGSTYSPNVYIFDTITEMWLDNTNIPNAPYPSFDGCLTSNATHLFLVGGRSDLETDIDRLQIYDVNYNNWWHQQLDLTPINGNGWLNGYCSYGNDHLYIFSGKAAGNRINHIFKWNEIEQWSHIGYLPSALTNGVSLHHNQNVYIIGGYDGAEPSASIYEFDTNTDQISNIYQMTEALRYVAAGIIRNKLYVFGGWRGADNITDDVQMCDIINNVPTKNPTNIPTKHPTQIPTNYPSNHPTDFPTHHPTNDPTIYSPTDHHTMQTSTKSLKTHSVQPSSSPSVHRIESQEKIEETTVVSVTDLESRESSHPEESDIHIIIIGLILLIVCIICGAYCIYRILQHIMHRKKNEEVVQMGMQMTDINNNTNNDYNNNNNSNNNTDVINITLIDSNLDVVTAGSEIQKRGEDSLSVSSDHNNDDLWEIPNPEPIKETTAGEQIEIGTNDSKQSM